MSDGTLYKVLDAKRRARNGGQGRYPDVGEWTEHLDPGMLAPCVYGYHLVGLSSLSRWLGPKIYEAEPCPDHEPVVQGGKVVTCSVRLVRKTAWDETSARLFAADCAEMALMGERAQDERLWDAVRVARAFAHGDATDSQRDVAEAAAGDAAGDGGWAAARVAARAAARADVWDAVEATVWAASVAAVRAVDKEADKDPARDAAYLRFGERLAAYLDSHDPRPTAPLYGDENGAQNG